MVFREGGKRKTKIKMIVPDDAQTQVTEQIQFKLDLSDLCRCCAVHFIHFIRSNGSYVEMQRVRFTLSMFATDMSRPLTPI